MKLYIGPCLRVTAISMTLTALGRSSKNYLSKFSRINIDKYKYNHFTGQGAGNLFDRMCRVAQRAGKLWIFIRSAASLVRLHLYCQFLFTLLPYVRYLFLFFMLTLLPCRCYYIWTGFTYRVP